ncbi:tyrosine-protein phosphatase [Tomitella fengzijianii]|uniref:Tyrosine-protein phosphatase n=1 Tax=Tomitella fengzijianii TaxID=2597660 RepID=A0A516X389_9ACTN|nr:tyrosine-protein phosphatase [Tomitella fengzijianii]QDQ97517.1 tyrosine-protein phosphatase [Tomitella fengzijianii]
MQRRWQASLGAVGLASLLTLTACGSSDSGPADSQVTNLRIDRDDAGGYTLTWEGPADASVFASTTAADPSESGKKVADSSDRSATVDGLAPADRWYFQVADGDGSEIASTRQFHLEGAHNVRDMGGFTTEDGRTTVWGHAFRGDSLSDLTAADDQALEAADVATVVNFLGDSEIARSGPDKLPDTTELVRIPVLDDNTQALSTALQNALSDGDPGKLDELLGGGKAERLGDEGFTNQLANPDTMAGYGKTLRLIADNEGALLYHCSAGKDRTGMMSAILLGVLGVDDQTIVDDFVASNKYNQKHNEQTYAYLEDKGVDVDLIKPLMEQRPSEIEPVLKAIHTEYGGWDEFAHNQLGLDDETLSKLRNTMLD